MTVSLGDAKEISIDAAVDGDFSKPGGFFILKEEQRTKLRGFPQWKRCFALLPAGFGKSLTKHGDAGQ